MNTLNRHFGTTSPHTFQRPAYKWVHSPLSPDRLKPYPLTFFDNCGNAKIRSRRNNCPLFIRSSCIIQNPDTARLSSICGSIKSSFPFQRRKSDSVPLKGVIPIHHKEMETGATLNYWSPSHDKGLQILCAMCIRMGDKPKEWTNRKNHSTGWVR